MICPHCKANVKVQGKFCPNCGEQILGVPVQTPPQAGRAASPTSGLPTHPQAPGVDGIMTGPSYTAILVAGALFCSPLLLIMGLAGMIACETDVGRRNSRWAFFVGLVALFVGVLLARTLFVGTVDTPAVTPTKAGGRERRLSQTEHQALGALHDLEVALSVGMTLDEYGKHVVEAKQAVERAKRESLNSQMRGDFWRECDAAMDDYEFVLRVWEASIDPVAWDMIDEEAKTRYPEVPVSPSTDLVPEFVFYKDVLQAGWARASQHTAQAERPDR